MDIGGSDLLAGMPGMPAIPSFSNPQLFMGPTPPPSLARTARNPPRNDHIYPGRPLQ